MHHTRHRLTLDLGIAVGDRDRGFFVHGADRAQIGAGQHAIVDDCLMHSHEAIAGNGGKVLDSQATQHVDHVVAAATRVGQALKGRCGLR